MKILVVDDDAFLRRVVVTRLKRTGYDPVEAENGQEAWQILQTSPIRYVITDWMMPEMDGLELTRKIRGADLSAYTYIILLTARESQDDIVAGLEAGADDYIVKPFDPEEFRARVAIGARILNLEDRLVDSMHRLKEQAMHDTLTGLLNRRALYEHTEGELSRARRENSHISLVLLDIDHFKAVNDEHGHLVGDEALKLAARVIAHSKRPYDWAGRWGGEEFMIVLPQTAIGEARIVAERVREQMAAAEFRLPNNDLLPIRVSLGVTSTSINSPDLRPMLDFLLHQADEALYRAKRGGRNRVCVYESTEVQAG